MCMSVAHAHTQLWPRSFCLCCVPEGTPHKRLFLCSFPDNQGVGRLRRRQRRVRRLDFTQGISFCCDGQLSNHGFSVVTPLSFLLLRAAWFQPRSTTSCRRLRLPTTALLLPLRFLQVMRNSFQPSFRHCIQTVFFLCMSILCWHWCHSSQRAARPVDGELASSPRSVRRAWPLRRPFRVMWFLAMSCAACTLTCSTHIMCLMHQSLPLDQPQPGHSVLDALPLLMSSPLLSPLLRPVCLQAFAHAL
jgi:hypothetical protein